VCSHCLGFSTPGLVMREMSMKRTFFASMQSTVEDGNIKIIELAYMLAHTSIVFGISLSLKLATR